MPWWSSRSPGKTAVVWLSVAAIGLGIFFRLYHLERKTVWEDEVLGVVRMLGYTEAEVVREAPRFRTAADLQRFFTLPNASDLRPPTATIHALATEDPQHPPLYYLIVRSWVARAGTSVGAIRFPAAVFGILALAAMYWLAYELLGDACAAWIAAGLLALSPVAVLYSQEAREYSCWSFIILVSSALLLRAARTRDWKFWAAYGASVALGLYIYPLTALVVAAHGAFLLSHADFRRRRVLVSFLCAGGIAALLFVPWALLILAGNGSRGLAGIEAARLTDAQIVLTCLRDIKASVIDLGAIHHASLKSLGRVAGAGTILLVAFAAWDLIRQSKGPARAFLLALVLVPAVPLVAHDWLDGGMLVYQGRYFEPVYPAVNLILARLLWERISASGGSFARAGIWCSMFVLVLAAGALSCGLSARATTWYNKDYERTPEVAAIINDTPSAVVIGDASSHRALGLSYYLRPSTPVRLVLICDICKLPAQDAGGVFADVSAFQNVFSLGAQPAGLPALDGAIRHIGLGTFPVRSDPLDMFGAAPPD